METTNSGKWLRQVGPYTRDPQVPSETPVSIPETPFRFPPSPPQKKTGAQFYQHRSPPLSSTIVYSFVEQRMTSRGDPDPVVQTLVLIFDLRKEILLRNSSLLLCISS